mgnify:CR=1 FL=1
MKATATETTPDQTAPDFCAGMQHFGEPWPGFDTHAAAPAVGAGSGRIAQVDADAAYQTLLMADALRYVTLQVCGSKGSGHPGGFASSAEAYAALVMLGHTNIVTEVGHHAPGFYSAMFLDRSLEEMGIRTVDEMMLRFRERHGLLGHLSGAIPGLLAPAGPLGQGQHFAMAGALLHPGTLFPVTIGDGGMGEPYVLNSMMHFHTAYPQVTNFLPVLIWNGYSQEHHAMVSTWDNERMVAYWRAHGFQEVILVDAKPFDDSGQEGPYVDSTHFSLDRRLAFARAVLQGMDQAARSALAGTPTAFVIKQLNPGDGTSIYHVFERLNTGGTQLVSQEIRNCIYHGPFNDLLCKLNSDASWRKLFGKASPDRRQRDVELILRFLALRFSHDEYQKPMKDFLSKFMAVHRRDESSVLASYEEAFKGAVEEVLIEGKTERTDFPFWGRTRFQAPEIDGVTHIRGGKLREGMLADCRITAADDYDLYAEAL